MNKQSILGVFIHMLVLALAVTGCLGDEPQDGESDTDKSDDDNDGNDDNDNNDDDNNDNDSGNNNDNATDDDDDSGDNNDNNATHPDPDKDKDDATELSSSNHGDGGWQKPFCLDSGCHKDAFDFTVDYMHECANCHGRNGASDKCDNTDKVSCLDLCHFTNEEIKRNEHPTEYFSEEDEDCMVCHPKS